jgi:acetyl-CoA carboxylase biotin carboxyl carrier protein
LKDATLSKKPPKSKNRVPGLSGSRVDPMDVGLLENLVKLMEANDLNTVELRDGERRVVLKRGAVMSSGPMMVAQPASAAPAAAKTPEAAAVDEMAGLHQIKSPMVGTFYSAPSPDAKPFVSVGAAVTEETDVCVIEAMKVFNNVKAECHGTIAKILVTNGEAVEFGQVLFLVKP